jgi:hypothetical protein
MCAYLCHPGAEFIEVFKNFRDNLERTIGKRPKFLVQGTL